MQSTTVDCLPTALWASLLPHGGQGDARDLSRAVAFSTGGADTFDLQRELAARGFDSLVFTGPPEVGARLVEAGFAPVAFVKRGAARHAVVVHGVTRARAGDACGALETLTAMDPDGGRTVERTARDFAAWQSEAQWIVAFRPGDRARLASHGFPLMAAEAENRAWRARALELRARAHGEDNAQARGLLEAAQALRGGGAGPGPSNAPSHGD